VKRVLGLVCAVLAMVAIPAAAQQPGDKPNVGIDPAARTVTTSDFPATWNTGVDTEAITSLDWRGGANVTSTYELNTCGNIGEGGNIQYFGNGWSPPDPQSGG
jgi:hypothetical protein